jgi:type I restriction enzyme S subunit
MKEATKVIGGSTPSTKNPDYWGGNICWTSPKDLSNFQGLILLDTAKKITEKGLSKVSSGLLPSNTVLMSSRAPIGYLALTRIPMAINQGYIAFGQNKIFGTSYLLNWCKFNLPVIEAYAGGSVFPEISKSNFKEIRCVIPRVEILEIFETICQPLFNQLEVNARAIKSLEDTRDTLLPRLMSGELSVEGLED